MKHTRQHQKTTVIPFSALTREDVSNSDDKLILEGLDAVTDETMHSTSSPSVLGEQSVSGDMADPESDDDTLQNAQQVGLQTEDDYENPQELNAARDVEEGERLHRSS